MCIPLQNPEDLSGLTETLAPVHAYAGCRLHVQDQPGARPSVVVEGPSRQLVVAPEPLPGLPSWWGRCDALFHARRMARVLTSAS